MRQPCGAVRKSRTRAVHRRIVSCDLDIAGMRRAPCDAYCDEIPVVPLGCPYLVMVDCRTGVSRE
jgi:hypothetical protein